MVRVVDNLGGNMKNTLDVVLILALPASGKSEVRKFLRSLNPDTLSEYFHLGNTIDRDDYPYVAFMRAVDTTLAEMGRPRLFFQSDDKLWWSGLSRHVNRQNEREN